MTIFANQLAPTTQQLLALLLGTLQTKLSYLWPRARSQFKPVKTGFFTAHV